MKNNNNKNFLSKDLKVFFLLVFLAIILIISLLYLDNTSMEYLCDSTSSHDFVNEDSDRVPSEGGIFKISSLYNSFKRRLSWYALDKDSGKYNSYIEFKNNWDTKTRLWDIIKADLEKSRADTRARRRYTDAYDRRRWEFKWARRAAEDRSRFERRSAAFRYRSK